ncbi:hypothetical protein TNCV_4988941 [Trichonephila clavipes]|nr:hypothetical protein TNCV_4988941 [Trichonephila clavipes]
MIITLKQSNAQDEHDPTFVEMVKQCTLPRRFIDKAVSESALYLTAIPLAAHHDSNPPASSLNNPTYKERRKSLFLPLPESAVRPTNLLQRGAKNLPLF